ncbi:MAG: hypothetical protein U9R28_05060 [Pseudomonadota bacterium]|nr:hypothetical protein [Pseudomonadota bacterium]
MSGAKAKIGGVRPSIIVLVGSFILLGLFILVQPQREEVDQSSLPWNAQFDDQGQLHALGVVLNQTTLREAMDIYGKDVEIRIFTDRDGSNKKAEAYFPAMYIGSIKAAAAVNLKVSTEELELVYNRGAKISPTTSGGREVKLSSQDNYDFLDKTIESITLIPRKNLDERSIEMRFGQPDRRETQDDGLERLYYDKLGLEMIIDPEGPEALQYLAK